MKVKRNAMTVEDYKKLLDAEGLLISNIEDGWIYCDPYSFEKFEYGWNGEMSVKLENEWRARLSHISDQIDFSYDEFTDRGNTYSTFELSLYIREIEKVSLGTWINNAMK